MKPMDVSRLLHISPTVALCGMLTACATYTPRPLPATVAWHDSATDLRVETGDIALPALAAQRIDLHAPLPMSAIAALAVLNDPRLRAARDRAGVARAEAFAAGLLPAPKLAAKRDIPQGQSGTTTTAYNLGLSINLGQLITRGAAVAAARDHVREVDLRILWQEWQTASAAELDYIALVGLRERDHLLDAQRAAVAKRLERDRAAAMVGVAPRTTADADLIELTALQHKLVTDASQREVKQDELDAMLGLRPGKTPSLAGLPRLDTKAVQRAAGSVDKLGKIRPDLMALRAGYASQEQVLRKAVLSQFPSVGITLSRARDTSNVHTLGFGINFSLPIFNGSPGRIAVASATRTALYDTYRLRLQQARTKVARILAELAILCHEQFTLRTSLPTLQSAAQAANAALGVGDITLPQAQMQDQALLDQRLALQTNEQQIAERTVALQLLTGSGIFAAEK
ncbi:MAG: TolC family protein [Candidimonas sp.]|nr:MAG: TolC family protein [Candidimonas sp.]TAM20498.1 MAG: TolC family protein [Candidimonas sp.]TAM77903.1 MAG: TolC family protein [Candidimonas sp.]